MIGYEVACAIAVEAHRTGRPVLDLVRERTSLDETTVLALTSSAGLTGRATSA